MGIEHSTEEQSEFKSQYMRGIPEGEPFSEVDEFNLKLDRMMYRDEQANLHPVEKFCINVGDKISDIVNGSKNFFKNAK